MRAVLDASMIGSGRGGDETALLGFIDGLASVATAADSFSVMTRPDVAILSSKLADRRFRTVEIRRHPGLLHYGASLPAALSRMRPNVDVVVSYGHAPLWSPAKVALVVPDLSFVHHPEFYPRSTRYRLQLVVARQVRTVAAVLTISEFSRNDLIDVYRLDPRSVHVVPLAIAPPATLAPEVVERTRRTLAERSLTGPFILSLSNLHPRKNVVTLIRAFCAAQSDALLGDTKLVIAGARWWGQSVEEEAARAARPGSIVFLGRVDEVAREYLLQHATAFAYLSLFEGFGLPPLEAMARGVPTITSDRAALAEVAGPAALLVDPLDVASVTEALHRAVTSEALRVELRHRGAARAEEFTAARTGHALITALRSVTDARRSDRSVA